MSRRDVSQTIRTFAADISCLVVWIFSRRGRIRPSLPFLHKCTRQGDSVGSKRDLARRISDRARAV
jgi:hypothetical protein